MTKEEFRQSEKIPLVIVLDNVRSGYNAGSVFRTADAFRAEAIYICGITAVPPHKEILKTALGATETVSWKYFKRTEDALAALKKNGYSVFAVEQTDKSILLDDFATEKGRKYALVFGHEVDGVSNEVLPLCDGSIEVQQHGTKHSLNIAVCAGIVVYEMERKLRTKIDAQGSV